MQDNASRPADSLGTEEQQKTVEEGALPPTEGVVTGLPTPAENEEMLVEPPSEEEVEGPVEAPLGEQSVNAPTLTAPVAQQDPRALGERGSTVHFVMPTDFPPPYRIREATVVDIHFGQRLDLDVMTDPKEDGLPSPFRYPRIGHDESKRPGTWHY